MKIAGFGNFSLIFDLQTEVWVENLPKRIFQMNTLNVSTRNFQDCVVKLSNRYILIFSLLFLCRRLISHHFPFTHHLLLSILCWNNFTERVGTKWIMYWDLFLDDMKMKTKYSNKNELDSKIEDWVFEIKARNAAKQFPETIYRWFYWSIQLGRYREK